MSFPAELDIRLSSLSHYYCCFYCNLGHFFLATFQPAAVWTHTLMLWTPSTFCTAWGPGWDHRRQDGGCGLLLLLGS